MTTESADGQQDTPRPRGSKASPGTRGKSTQWRGYLLYLRTRRGYFISEKEAKYMPAQAQQANKQK